jgi:signal transduction histidine kinase
MGGLLLDTHLDEEQFDYATTIKSSSEALLCIINDILDYSKIDAGGFLRFSPLVSMPLLLRPAKCVYSFFPATCWF